MNGSESCGIGITTVNDIDNYGMLNDVIIVI